MVLYDDSVAAPAAENTVTLEILIHHQEIGKMDTLTAEGLCTAICLDPRHFPTKRLSISICFLEFEAQFS